MLNQEQQIIEQIKKANNILVTFNKTWNGDAVASALAIFLFLKKMDKNVTVAAEKFDQGQIFSFLPAYDRIGHSLSNLRKFIISLDTTNTQVDKVKYSTKNNILEFAITPRDGFFSSDDVKSFAGDFKYDLVIVVDTPDLESLGQIYETDADFFYQVPIINIDHHSNNEEFGQINYVDLTSVATAEIIFRLIENYSRDLIDEDVATCLLAGIISKTRSFKTQNITPRALNISSQLISIGARHEDIINQFYRSRPLNVFQLWGRVLARISSTPDNQMVWSILSSQDFAKTGTNENDLEEVIDELIVKIPQAKIIIIIYEMEERLALTGEIIKATKALIYTLKNINALDLVKDWNPVGTKNLAKIVIPKNLDEAEKEISETIQKNISKLQL
jgi:bifunctional oligoribonuclease and PAP phosphatase NrnA